MLPDLDNSVHLLRNSTLPGLHKLGKRPLESDGGLRERIRDFVDGVHQLERRL